MKVDRQPLGSSQKREERIGAVIGVSRAAKSYIMQQVMLKQSSERNTIYGPVSLSLFLHVRRSHKGQRLRVLQHIKRIING